MEQGSFGHLVRVLSRLPGLGPRSARRIALHLLTGEAGQTGVLAQALTDAAQTLKKCSICGNLDDQDPCMLCTDPVRERGILCVVAGVSDLWAIERTHQFRGQYHVLGGVLSAIDGVTPDHLRMAALLERIKTETPREIVFALPATVDGQTTAHYLNDLILQNTAAGLRPHLTRLALGLPMGGELDYLDDGTISAALKARAAV